MNDATMKRLLTLAEKTGDKVIVTDPAGEQPYVLMTLDQYERLIGQPSAASHKPSAPEPKAEEKPAEPKKTLLAAGKFRLPIQDADLGIGAALLKPQTPSRKPQASTWKPLFPRKAPEKVAASSAEEAVLDPEGEEQFFLEPLE